MERYDLTLKDVTPRSMKTWNVFLESGASVELERDDGGEWVRHEDAQADIARLRSCLESLRTRLGGFADDWTRAMCRDIDAALRGETE